MTKNVDYEQRKRLVLAATIDRYIANAVAVSSGDIAQAFNLSSATIRNIFAELENEGYLTHPYTSGGRIPTNKGYRYYVDFLIRQMELLDAEKDRISSEYRKKITQLEEALDKTSEVISSVTHCAGIVSLLGWQDKLFYRGISQILDEPEFHDYERIRFIIKMIEDKQGLLDIINRGVWDKINIYIGEELGCPEAESCSLVVSTYGSKNKPSGRLAVLGPKRMKYDHIISSLEYISGVLTDVINKI